MPVIKRHSRALSYLQFSLPSENTLIAVLLGSFLTLHMLAGAILEDPMRVGTTAVQEEPRASSYD